ncbi:hypothetical protein HK57_00193 [Aspergillus ustus]|uniref:Uncharacterized protein n=1 Tax=Aspergillus ustus TaxID=40382 RepID=A0A0C1C2U3_ASPUT|nr:hypothetical protein HK57_00193 [Aspergillus ustus]
MKFSTALLPFSLSVSLLAANTLAVSVTRIQKGGKETELEIATDGVCVDLFQGTYGAVLNDGVNGTACVFWVYVSLSFPLVEYPHGMSGNVTTCKREVEFSDGANGIRCFAPGTD